MKPARVFISCGQARYTDEDQIGRNIADSVCKLGFKPYVAVAQQRRGGLNDNIFAWLRNSEYFVFVDFKRDLIGEHQLHRGSLFAHQGLAVAAFLELDVIALQEKGVKWDDGILPFVQAN